MAARLDGAGMHNGDGSSPLLRFYEERFAPERHQRVADSTRANYRYAIKHFERYLKRPAEIGDLTTAHIAGLIQDFAERGRKPKTALKSRDALMALGHAAVAWGLIAVAPYSPKPYQPPSLRKLLPWSIDELNAILGSARTMGEDVDGIPASLWWPALLLVLLDTGADVPRVLRAAVDDFDCKAGTLAVGPLVYRLHPLTIEALERIRRHGQSRLLPWSLDGGKPPFYMLLRAYKTLLYRANLPYTESYLFNKLRVSRQRRSTVFASINLQLAFRPRGGKPTFPRAKARRVWGKKRRTKAVPKTHASARESTGSKPARDDAADVVWISNNSERALHRFYADKYRPLRLSDAAPQTKQHYPAMLNRLREFAACDVTLDQLSDDFVERFMVWARQRGAAPATVNGYRACILALWRFAYRKRYLDDQPRCVEKLKLPRRIPEAWSLEEVNRLLRAAAGTEGTICGVAAGVWWPALLLVLYDTGLRIAAVMNLTREALDMETGELFVPAEIQKHNSDQVFRLHRDTLDAVRLLEPRTREMLIPWHAEFNERTNGMLYSGYRKILHRAGLAAGRRDLFHKLRRTSGTLLASVAGDKAGADHLGHSDPKVFVTHYLDPRKLNRARATDLLPRPEWNQ